jgi:hypothetical protein
MNFVPELFYKMTKFMCKNELFQSSGTKNELFKVQERKTKLMYNLGTKTIFWPIFLWLGRVLEVREWRVLNFFLFLCVGPTLAFIIINVSRLYDNLCKRN